MAIYTIIFSNSAGELERRSAETLWQVRQELIAIVNETPEFIDGDTIRIEVEYD
jgi:hypothetical protein